MTPAKTREVQSQETPRVQAQQVPVDASKLIAQLRSMDPNFVRSALKEAGIVKAFNRPASIAHVWGRDKNVLASIAKVLGTAYVVSEPKASKKGIRSGLRSCRPSEHSQATGNEMGAGDSLPAPD